jgi:hypothetical protein
MKYVSAIVWPAMLNKALRYRVRFPMKHPYVNRMTHYGDPYVTEVCAPVLADKTTPVWEERLARREAFKKIRRLAGKKRYVCELRIVGIFDDTI